jgi:hypothetical protein
VAVPPLPTVGSWWGDSVDAQAKDRFAHINFLIRMPALSAGW